MRRDSVDLVVGFSVVLSGVAEDQFAELWSYATDANRWHARAFPLVDSLEGESFDAFGERSEKEDADRLMNWVVSRDTVVPALPRETGVSRNWRSSLIPRGAVPSVLVELCLFETYREVL